MLGRLRPIGLAEFGLAAAIDNLVEFWRRRDPEIVYRVDIAPDAEGFGELLDPTVYRIVQEVPQQCDASRPAEAVTVALSRRCAGGAGEDELTIMVADDGQGMAAPARGTGYGLLGMSERVKALGGDSDICQQPGQRTDRHRDIALRRRGAGAAERDLGVMKILIVDDHPIVRDGLRRLLAGEPGCPISRGGDAARRRSFCSARHSPTS